MKIEGDYQLAADVETVWRDLNDPEILNDCIPGCEGIEQVGDAEFECVITNKIGPVKATFKSILRITDSKPPHSYTLSGEGKGGPAGFGKGSADVELESNDEGTLLKYQAELTVGGKLAQIGSRLLSSTTKKLSEKFFTAFSERYSE
ncbi:MAG: carbon monoxide dehydrogenase subunit G [Pseudomonadota bacterium]